MSEQTITVRAVALTGSDQTIRTRAGRYCGFAMRESVGSATASALVYDGTSAAGTLIDVVSLAISGSASAFYPDGGIICEKGIYVDVGGTGVIQGSIRVGD